MRRTLLAVAALALTPGCLFQVSQTAHPEAPFAEARASAAEAEVKGVPARRLKVLVWERDSQRLVRVSVPLGWARWALHKGLSEERGDATDAGSVITRRLADLTTEDLRKAGGLMVESADEDDGQRVLVWLR